MMPRMTTDCLSFLLRRARMSIFTRSKLRSCRMPSEEPPLPKLSSQTPNPSRWNSFMCLAASAPLPRTADSGISKRMKAWGTWYAPQMELILPWRSGKLRSLSPRLMETGQLSRPSFCEWYQVLQTCSSTQRSSL